MGVSWTAVVVLISLYLSSALSGEPPEFTDSDFKLRVKEKECTLVMFYAPWCGHCKHLKPTFQSARSKLLREHDNVELARVDCTVHTGICGEYSIGGYPTLKLFSDGKHIHDFSGPREEGDIINYMTNRCKPPIAEVASLDHLELQLNSEKAREQPVIIVNVRDDQLEKFRELASSMIDNAVFLYTHDADLAETNTVRLYRPKGLKTKLEDQFVETTFGDSITELKQWIYKHGHGLVGYRTPSNNDFFNKNNLLVFYNNASMKNYLKGVNYFRNRLIKIIRDFPELPKNLQFAYSYADDFQHELHDLKLFDLMKLPVAVIYSHGKKYKLEHYTAEAFKDFLKGFERGELNPFIKSEEIPSEQDGAAIKVVGHTFESVVNDPHKDVFVMFHAPWCGHCKQLLPKFKAAAEKMKDEKDIVFAMYDATANDVPPAYTIQGYPTLYMATKNGKQTPRLYEGHREVADLVKFVAAESTEELSGFDRKGDTKKSEL